MFYGVELVTRKKNIYKNFRVSNSKCESFCVIRFRNSIIIIIIIIIINRFYLTHPLYMVLRSNITFTQYTRTRNIKITVLFNIGHPVAIPARSFDNFFCVTT